MGQTNMTAIGALLTPVALLVPEIVQRQDSSPCSWVHRALGSALGERHRILGLPFHNVLWAVSQEPEQLGRGQGHSSRPE